MLLYLNSLISTMFTFGVERTIASWDQTKLRDFLDLLIALLSRRPFGCTIDFRCGLIHLRIILWNKPLEIGLFNKALKIVVIPYL